MIQPGNPEQDEADNHQDQIQDQIIGWRVHYLRTEYGEV